MDGQSSESVSVDTGSYQPIVDPGPVRYYGSERIVPETNIFRRSDFRDSNVVGEGLDGMSSSLKNVFESLLFRYTDTTTGEINGFIDETIPFLKYYSVDSLEEEFEKLKSMKKRMEEDTKNGIEEFEKCFKEKEDLFRRQVFDKLQGWMKRNSKLDKSIEEKSSKGLVKINFHTILSRIILFCSDAFEIIFSYLPVSDLLLNASISCSYFYYFIKSRVKLSLFLTKKMINVEYDILRLISKYRYRFLYLDVGEYFRNVNESTTITGEGKMYGIVKELIDKNRRSLESLNFELFRGVMRYDRNDYGCQCEYVLSPKDLMDNIKSCTFLRSLKIIHLTERFSEFLNEMSNLELLKFSIEDILFNLSRDIDLEFQPLHYNSKLIELSCIRYIITGYKIPHENLESVYLRKTKFNNFITNNLPNLQRLHTNFVDCREFSDDYVRFIVHQLHQVTIVRTRRISYPKGHVFNQKYSKGDLELNNFKSFVTKFRDEMKKRIKNEEKIPDIRFIYEDEYCEMKPLKITDSLQSQNKENEKKKQEIEVKSTYDFIEELQLLLTIPEICLSISSSIIVNDERNIQMIGIGFHQFQNNRRIGLIPLLDFSKSEISSLYVTQNDMFHRAEDYDQNLSNVFLNRSSLKEVVVSFNSRDTLREICDLICKSRSVGSVCMIINRGVSSLDERKVVLEETTKVIKKKIPSLERIGICGPREEDEEEEEEKDGRGYCFTNSRRGGYDQYHGVSGVQNVREMELMSTIKKLEEKLLEELSINPYIRDLHISILGKRFQRRIAEVLLVNESLYS